MSNPTLAVFPFVDDLDGESQSAPISLTGVEPILFDDGLVLRAGATNRCTNPSFESSIAIGDFSGAYTNGTATVQRETGDPDATGTYCISIAASGSPNGAMIYIVDTNVGASVLSFDCWLESGASDWVYEVTNDAFGSLVAATPFTATAGKQRLSIPFTTVSDPTALRVFIFRASAATGQLRVDAFRLGDDAEYVDGEQNGGDGYDWAGTPHESTSTRAASSASVPTAGIISPVAGAIAFRTTPTIETGLEEIWGECGVKGAGTDHLRWGRDASRHPFVEWSSNDAAYQRLTSTHTVDAEDEHFYYLGHDGTDITLQVDGNTLETDTRDAVEDDFSTGDLELQASAGGVIFHELAMFSEMLGPEQVAKLESTQNWSMNTLGGSTIIMPLTAGRRPRI